MPAGGHTTVRVTVAECDTVVLHTDGITETNNPEDEESGEERLGAPFVANRHLQPSEPAAARDCWLEEFARECLTPTSAPLSSAARKAKAFRSAVQTQGATPYSAGSWTVTEELMCQEFSRRWMWDPANRRSA